MIVEPFAVRRLVCAFHNRITSNKVQTANIVKIVLPSSEIEQLSMIDFNSPNHAFTSASGQNIKIYRFRPKRGENRERGIGEELGVKVGDGENNHYGGVYAKPIINDLRSRAYFAFIIVMLAGAGQIGRA